MSAREVIALTRHTVGFWNKGTDAEKRVDCIVGTETADAILAALDAAGFAIVPIELNTSILNAYTSWMNSHGDRSLVMNQDAWTAMLAASKVAE